MWMRCDFIKRATSLLALLVPAAFAATYTLTPTYEGELYYAIYNNSTEAWATNCSFLESKKFEINSRRVLPNYDLYVFSDATCETQFIPTGISFSDLYPTSQQAKITISNDGTWKFTSQGGFPGGQTNPGGDEPGRDDPRDPQQPGDNPGGRDNPGANGKKVIAFFTPWTNTNAILYVNGDSVSAMSAMDKYCGWFITNSKSSGENLNVYFKQTIGGNYVGAEGLTTAEPTTATEISLDSVAALSDTIWVKGNQEGAPNVYSSHPAGVLGDCPLKKLPVMMFDWLHGKDGDVPSSGKGTPTGTNGDPTNGVSADFGSGGCSGSPMLGMVDSQLGPNGVPVPASPFPENCRITDHLAYWFTPESLAVDAQGNTLTNMTCRDLYISMDEEGFWLAEISKDAISKGNEANRGGMFLLDDFQYLDEETKTIPNPYYDQLRGGSDNRNHNFGFTMKIQATFEYVPGQYFDFLGDDDVWVFINNKLVVDIGGQHAQVRGAVNLDTIGQNNPADKLVPGEVYNFHIFYAERHTSSSNFRMHTSIDLKTEASILLKNPNNSDPNVIDREIWQKVRKNKLSCDFSSGEKELSLERGPSVFTLYGGNLPADGIELDSAGTWFGGITINKDFDELKIDSVAIKDSRGLAPGSYYIRVTLRSDNTQSKNVGFRVGNFPVPKLVYTDAAGNALGETVRSDVYQLNGSKDTMWVGQSYQVYVQYTDPSILPNDIVYPSTNDEALIPCDAVGNPITEIQLVDGKASFYVKAVGEVWGGMLYVKSASSNTAIWTGIDFALPPVPQIQLAYIYDRDGDGRGDSIWIQFDGKLGGKNSLDSAKFHFNPDPNDTTFSSTYKANYREGSTEATIVANGNGFSSSIITGGIDKPYSGQIYVWYTYSDNGHKSYFPVNGTLQDQIGPVVTSAEVSYMSDGNTQLVITFSEGIQDLDKISDLFSFHVWKNGVMSTEVKAASDVSAEAPNRWKLIFPKGADTDVIPAVGDSVRFAVAPSVIVAYDLVDVPPHVLNPWVRITGEQKVTITSPGVVTLNPESPAYQNAREIIRSEEATVPKVVQDPSILTAEQAAAAYGTQGHFLGDLNMAELVENEITDISKAVNQYMTSHNNNKVEDPETGLSFTLEQIIAAVDGGSMSINEAKKRFDLDPMIVDAYKNGVLNSQNINMFVRGTESDIKQIVEAVAQSTELYYKATYYSSLGEFVNSYSNVITCNDDVFKEHGQGTCLENNGKLFLAWNMRANNGRLVSTGVYIARLEYRIKVGSKTMVNRTQDFLWGVRRGKANALDLGL